MTTPYMYIVSPEGDRYTNSKEIEGKELILNTTMDETDFRYTNRIGRIEATPRRSDLLRKGDRVIVHHNTFRKWFNVRGKLKDSANFVREGAFYVGHDQIFAFDRGDGWTCIEDYCFIKPIERENSQFYSDVDKYESKVGIVKFGNKILEEQGVFEGDKIQFVGECEYAFKIDGELLWKMSAYRNVKLKL